MAETVKDAADELQKRLNADTRVSEGVSWGRYLDQLPRIKCADGFEMSVQASSGHYCAPRDSYGPWYQVEIGYPSEKVEAFMLYIDDSDSEPTDTVYGYVPIEVVAQAIVDHGGFAQPSPALTQPGTAL